MPPTSRIGNYMSEPTPEEVNRLLLLYQGLYSHFVTKTSTEKPLLLAHYTSVQVVEQIVKHEELWFSNPLYMNDLSLEAHRSGWDDLVARLPTAAALTVSVRLRQTLRCHCRHPNLVRAAPPLRPDMIFGKDRPEYCHCGSQSLAFSQSEVPRPGGSGCGRRMSNRQETVRSRAAPHTVCLARLPL